MATHVAEEHLLSVNSYEEPKVLYDHNAIYTLIIRLLLLDPGKDPDRPDKGVGLLSLYRYSFESDIDALRLRVKDQIKTYLPDLISVDVNLEVFGSTLGIYVKTENVTYGIKFDPDSGEVAPLTLDDIK